MLGPSSPPPHSKPGGLRMNENELKNAQSTGKRTPEVEEWIDRSNNRLAEVVVVVVETIDLFGPVTLPLVTEKSVITRVPIQP